MDGRWGQSRIGGCYAPPPFPPRAWTQSGGLIPEGWIKAQLVLGAHCPSGSEEGWEGGRTGGCDAELLEGPHHAGGEEAAGAFRDSGYGCRAGSPSPHSSAQKSCGVDGDPGDVKKGSRLALEMDAPHSPGVLAARKARAFLRQAGEDSPLSPPSFPRSPPPPNER